MNKFIKQSTTALVFAVLISTLGVLTGCGENPQQVESPNYVEVYQPQLPSLIEATIMAEPNGPAYLDKALTQVVFANNRFMTLGQVDESLLTNDFRDANGTLGAKVYYGDKKVSEVEIHRTLTGEITVKSVSARTNNNSNLSLLEQKAQELKTMKEQELGPDVTVTVKKMDILFPNSLGTISPDRIFTVSEGQAAYDELISSQGFNNAIEVMIRLQVVTPDGQTLEWSKSYFPRADLVAKG